MAVDRGVVAMFVLLRRPDGSPTGYPMTGVWHEGALEFTTYLKAAKARYLLADDRVCCVIPEEDDPGRALAVWGRARLVDDLGGFAGSIDRRDSPISVPESVRGSVAERLRSRKRVVFRVVPERRATLRAPEVSRVPA